MDLSSAIVALGALILVEIALSHRRLMRTLTTRRDAPSTSPAPPTRWPSITVVRPIRGRDVEAEANLRAVLDTGYPGDVETLFVLDDADDPAYPLVEAAVREHREAGRPGTASLVVAGAPPPGLTGKLHAMMVGERIARGDLIAFGDSDTRPDRQVLRVLVERLLGTPTAGCAFAPVVVNGAPRASGDVGYAMLINGWYGPSVALSAEASGGEVPFIMGQLMVFRREALAAIGGVGCAAGQLVDDMAIGACVHRAGWRNILVDHPLYIATGGMTMAGFVKLFRRWLLFSRNGLPASFTWPMWLRGVEFWGASLAVIVGLLARVPGAALVPAAALVAFVASQLRIQQTFGGAHVPLRWAWVPFAIPLVAPAIIVDTTLRAQVDWRGREYALHAPTARLAAES
jgi:ceramide glucosyltransferase